MRCRRLVLAAVAAGALLMGGAGAASASTIHAAVPVHHAARAASGEIYLCDNSGRGSCIQNVDLDWQELVGLPYQQFEGDEGIGVVRGSCNATGDNVWPFKNGTGFNNLYCGDSVGYIVTVNGNCLGLYNPGGTMQTIVRPCDGGANVMWVGVGNWLVNVQATNIQDDYPYGSAMKAGCQTDCYVWIQAHQPGNATDQWGTVSG
jgi:hypothetical protein